MPDWEFDVDDESIEKQNIRVVIAIVTILIILGAGLYYFAFVNQSSSIISKIIPFFGKGNSGGNSVTVNIVSVENLNFKNTSNRISVPLLNLNQPNMFSKFDLRINLIPSSPLPITSAKFTVKLVQDNKVILTLNKTVDNGFPDYIEFQNISLNSSKVNEETKVYVTIESDSLYINDNYAGSFPYNKIGLGDKIVQNTGTVLKPSEQPDYIIDYSVKDKYIKKTASDVTTNTNSGTITLIYPLIDQYSKGMAPYLIKNLQDIFKNWYFSTQTLYTIRSLVESEYSGEHTIYESVNGNIRFDSIDYKDSKHLTIKFTPYYDYTLKVPYAVTILYYKIQNVVIGKDAINNYFTITGSESQIEYLTLHGYLQGSLKELFKSIHLTVVVYTESGLERNIDFGDFDIVTGKTVLINDEGKAYLNPDDNSITIEITNPTVRRIDKVIITLNLNQIEDPQKPYLSPKYYIQQNSKTIKTGYLPQSKPSNQITVQPSNTVKIDRYIIIKSREDAQINEIFIPYPDIEKDRGKVITTVTNEIMKSKYIPENAEDIVKDRVSTVINGIEPDETLKPVIVNAKYVFKPATNGFGFQILLNLSVRVYGVMLKPVIEYTKVIDDTGNVFYYDIKGFNLNPTNKASIVESVLVPLKLDDYQVFRLKFTTTGNSSEIITITPSNRTVQSYYVDMGHKFHFSIKNGNTVIFSDPVPVSLLPRVEVEESKLPEMINIDLPIYSKTSGNIFIGAVTSVKNTVMYLHSSVINLYGQGEYLASKSAINLIDNVNNYISVNGNVTSAGVYYIDSNGTFMKSYKVQYSGYYIKLTPSTISDIKNMIENNNTAVVYVFYVDSNDNVHYEELRVNSVEPHISKMMIALTNIQSTMKSGGLQFLSDSQVTAIEGYYTMAIYVGFFRSVNNANLTVNAVFKDNSKATIFSCTESKCEFKLSTKDWVFDNDKYTVNDTSFTYSGQDGAFIVNILPIVSVINNKQVFEYTVSLSFNGDGKTYSAKFVIIPQQRQYLVNINPVMTTYLTVKPVVISYSSQFDDLYYYEMMIHEPPLNIILNGVKVKVVNTYQSFGFGDDIVKLIGRDGKTLAELVKSGMFKYERTEYGILIYPTNIQYDSNSNPHNYKFDKNDIVLFLPLVADYDFVITSPLLDGQEVMVKVTRNYLNFHYYEFTPIKKNIVAEQTVNLTYVFSVPGLPDEYLSNLAKALAKLPKDDFKVYLVSSVNNYYECDVLNVSVGNKMGMYYVSVKVRVPSDVPEGTYAFAITQTGFKLLDTPVLTFDELYNDNPVNKFFVTQTINYATDFLITTNTVTGAVIWGLNYGILYHDTTAKIQYLPGLLISGGQFKLFKLSNNNHYIFRVYSADQTLIYVPVLLHYPHNYQELFYYPQQVYLVSVNNPSFKGYQPKDYVKSIHIVFDNGLRHVELNLDVQSMQNNLPFSLFAVIDYNGKKLYYLPVSITPYFMTYLPERAELKVDIELVNGAEITRDIILLPTVVRVKNVGGKYYIDSASTVIYYKQSGGSYFGFTTLNIGTFDSPVVKVSPTSDSVQMVYYNVEVPLRLLASNNIMFNKPDVNKYPDLILLLDKLSMDSNYVKRVDFPAPYSLAGVLEVTYGENYLYNGIFYMRFDNKIDMNVVTSVHSPDLNLIKEYLKSNGWVLRVDNTTFRVLAYTYDDNYYLAVYVESGKNNAFFLLNLLSIINGNGAKVVFNGKVYYIKADSVSYSTGLVNGLMVGVK